MNYFSQFRWFIIAIVIFFPGLQSCTNNDPDFRNSPETISPQAQKTIPYTNLEDQLRQTDQKRNEEYQLLRKQMESNHAILMYRVQMLQDSTIKIQNANNQQIIALRKQVHRLTQAVYLFLSLVLLGAAYLLFKTMKKRKRNRNIKAIDYKHTSEPETAVILSNPTND